MDILFARGEATVLEIQEKLLDPPTPMAIRRMVQILEEKSLVQRRKQGREFVYMPKQTRSRAGSGALSHVIETFFGGSMEDALAAHLGQKGSKFSEEELSRLSALIEDARKKGN